MFAKIRKRLTFRYTIVMMLTLLAFIGVIFTGLVWMLYQEKQQDLNAFADEEVREQAAMYREQGSFSSFELEETVHTEIGSKLFHYVFDKDGQMAAAEKPEARLRQGVSDILGSWNEADGAGRLKTIRLPDGGLAIVMICSRKIYDGPQLAGTVFVGEDITSYYQMLKILFMLMLSVSALFSGIAALAGYFLAGKAMIPIGQAFSRQREFVADASHELRTPLSVLHTSVEAVQTDGDQQLSLFSVQVLDDMKSEIRRMTKLVTDLLTLARADAGATYVIKEKFDLAAMAEQLVRSLQPLAAVKEVELELHSDAALPVMADRERMGQLLLILVDNAIKYTPAGGRVKVWLARTTAPKPTVTVTVHDTGVGIEDSQKELIFERFYRVDKTRSREEGATGLGLSIAKWIVDVHGGKIRVESAPGQGSSFIVSLPM